MKRSDRQAAPGRVRIIAGRLRGSRIDVPAAQGLRPTADRVRETVFNWLAPHLHGAHCLDLFAGSGALGFEAASRRAARVVMVENDRAAFAVLEKTKAAIGAAQVELIFGDGVQQLKQIQQRFDVVFLDPPFGQNALPAVLRELPARLAPGARVYVEAEAAVRAHAPWAEIRGARAGQVSYQLLEWRSDDQGGLSRNV
jgi:16S rRNA (guanine966-N2)-methyltransferase